jgi:hypothetical protein
VGLHVRDGDVAVHRAAVAGAARAASLDPDERVVEEENVAFHADRVGRARHQVDPDLGPQHASGRVEVVGVHQQHRARAELERDALGEADP